MGFCYFHSQDFTNAALSYERLVSLFPNIEDYRLYYAQSLYHASLYDEAMNATCQIENPEFQGKVPTLLVIETVYFSAGSLRSGQAGAERISGADSGFVGAGAESFPRPRF